MRIGLSNIIDPGFTQRDPVSDAFNIIRGSIDLSETGVRSTIGAGKWVFNKAPELPGLAWTGAQIGTNWTIDTSQNIANAGFDITRNVFNWGFDTTPKLPGIVGGGIVTGGQAGAHGVGGVLKNIGDWLSHL